MDSNLYISALQRQPCLLKTNSTRVLVTWLITLLLIICPSSYKACLDNLIGPAISDRRSFLPNGAVPDRTSRPQMLWVGLSSSGTQARFLPHSPSQYPPLLAPCPDFLCRLSFPCSPSLFCF